jgi:hypothetical protein
MQQTTQKSRVLLLKYILQMALLKILWILHNNWKFQGFSSDIRIHRLLGFIDKRQQKMSLEWHWHEIEFSHHLDSGESVNKLKTLNLKRGYDVFG